MLMTLFVLLKNSKLCLLCEPESTTKFGRSSYVPEALIALSVLVKPDHMYNYYRQLLSSFTALFDPAFHAFLL